MDISGSTTIVTAAACGIGLGIATTLAEAGLPVRIDGMREQAVIDAPAEAEVGERLDSVARQSR